MSKLKTEYLDMSFEKTKEATKLQQELLEIRQDLSVLRERNRSKSQRLSRLRHESSYYCLLASNPSEAQEYKETFMSNKEKK